MKNLKLIFNKLMRNFFDNEEDLKFFNLQLGILKIVKPIEKILLCDIHSKKAV